MATAAKPMQLRGLRPAVIQALVGACRPAPAEGFRIPDGARPVIDILEAKGFVGPGPGTRYLTPRGAVTRRMLLGVAARYRAGNSALSIARTCEVNEKTIVRWLIAMNVPVRRNGARLRDEQRKAIARRYAHGNESQAALARSFGVSPNGIAYTLHKMQVPIRPPGRPPRPGL